VLQIEEECKPHCVKQWQEYKVSRLVALIARLCSHEAIANMHKHLWHACLIAALAPQPGAQACVERIQGDTTGQAHCSGQYFDFWHCVDHCVSPF